MLPTFTQRAEDIDCSNPFNSTNQRLYLVTVQYHQSATVLAVFYVQRGFTDFSQGPLFHVIPLMFATISVNKGKTTPKSS